MTPALIAFLLICFAGGVYVLLEATAGRITAPDPEHEDWPA